MDRLKTLRGEIAKAKLDGFLVPMADAFQSEYAPAESRRLEWLTGFTGSAGSAVVLAKKAAFFTDGRYTLQAAKQVDKKAFAIFSDAITPAQWLQANAKKATIGYDPWLYTPTQLKNLQGEYTLKPVVNLIDGIWRDRPSGSTKSAFVHGKSYAGEAADTKIKSIAKKIKHAGAEALLLASPTALCWLLNIRADDLPHTPVLLSYAIVYPDGKVQLFTDTKKITSAVKKHLGPKVAVQDTAAVLKALKRIGGKRVWVDTAETPAALVDAVKQILAWENPCNLPKACKNKTEIAGVKAAHIRDGAALCRFFHWLENAVANEKLTEVSIAEKLAGFRAEGKNFHGLSFDTIAGYAANGAIVHYRAEPGKCAAIGKGMLLVDSGAQYLDGTTDVTRTLHLGMPTAEQKEHFTRVLKGHIALARAVYPEGTRGSSLDVLARQHLWEAGLDYAHGTGHGVGYFLNVHEGPQRIAKRGGDAPFAVGMITSNEPGYYKTGAYGIRIESLVLTVPARRKGFLRFETLTMVPIDRKLVDTELLTVDETAWLNTYHAEVRKKVSPLLGKAEQEWLKRATAEL